MLRALRRAFLPNKVLLFRPAEEEPAAIARLAPFTAAQRALGGRATAYVCQAGSCQRPTTDIAEMLNALGAAAR
jgi:uncharacterized protein YyaL (SSP411 family)